MEGALNGEMWEVYTVLEESPTFYGDDTVAAARWGQACDLPGTGGAGRGRPVLLALMPVPGGRPIFGRLAGGHGDSTLLHVDEVLSRLANPNGRPGLGTGSPA